MGIEIPMKIWGTLRKTSRNRHWQERRGIRPHGQMEYYEMKQERTPPVRKCKMISMTCLTDCIYSFKSVRAAKKKKLGPPSISNVKNSVPVLHKHILRERAIWRIKEADLHCIIKEICVKLQKRTGTRRKWRLLFMVELRNSIQCLMFTQVRILVGIVHYFALQWLLYSCVILVHFQCLRVTLE